VKRVTLDIPDELFERTKAMPHGARSQVLRALLEVVIDAAEVHGSLIYGAVLDKNFTLTPGGTNAQSK
jgi:hypothetical protein